jgi:hypothetical protein
MKPHPPEKFKGKELPFAWERWDSLQKEVDAFLASPDVQRALKDDVFRLTEFTQPWKKAPEGVDVINIGKLYDGQKIKDLATLAVALRAMGNQTQKILARRGAQTGMREMTIVQEWMNLLLDGETFRGAYEALELVIPDPVQTIEGLRIQAVLAMEVLLRITKGDLEPGVENPVMTKTHGLYVIAHHQDRQTHARIARTNMIGTEKEIWEGYGYGTRDDGRKTRNKIQGGEFRAMQMREFGKASLPQLALQQHWRQPHGAAHTVLMSEVCTEAAVRQGISPTYFNRQWNIGFQAPKEEIIDLSRGNIREQVQRALPHITTAILHHPADNPVLR